MSKVKPILLQMHGLHQNCNRNIIFLPIEYTGLGYQHWFLVKGFEKLKLFLLHMRKQDTTCSLLKICLSYTQLEIGNSTSFFSRDPTQWKKYTTDTWLTDLWDFCFSCGATLNIPNQWLYTPPRENDIFMADIIESSNWDDTHKLYFHQIRIYLRILTLSDIVIIDKSSQILSSIQKCEHGRESDLDWPDSHPIPPSWKKHWKHFLTNTVAVHLYHKPLGAWKSPTHQRWSSFTSHNKSALRIQNTCYEKRDGEWKPSIRPTLCIYPADVEQGKIVGYKESIPYTNAPPQNTLQTFDILLSKSPSWKLRNIGFLPSLEQLQPLILAINSNQCIGVSDGSLRDSFPSHSWCFSNPSTGEIILRSSAPVDGDPSHITSFRAEAMGIIAMLSIIDLLRTSGHVKSSTIKLFSDGDSVIKKCKQPVESKSKYMIHNDIELVLEIRQLLRKNKSLVSLHYVPGHQDKNQQFQELDLQTQLNIIMDETVRTFIEDTEKRPTRLNTFPQINSTSAYLTTSAGFLTHNIEQVLHRQYYETKWLEYSSDKYNLCSFTRPLIDWTSLGKVLSNYKHSRGLPIKLIHNQHATHSRHKKWKVLTSSKCPLCPATIDSQFHVFSCQHSLMTTKQTNLRTSLVKIIEKMDTPTQLAEVIMLFYDHWNDPTILQIKIDNIKEKPRNLILAIANQFDIGCDLFPLGMISSAFGTCFSDMWVPYQGQRTMSSQRWMRTIIRAILDNFRDLWKLRCSTLNEENKETVEIAYRKELKEFHSHLRTHWWKFSVTDRKLVSLSDNFFDTTPLSSLEIWHRQVKVATTTSQFQAASQTADLRTFYPISRQARQPQQRQHTPLIPTQVLYRQKKLFTGSYRKKVTPIISPASIPPRTPTKINPITRWMIRQSSRRRKTPTSPVNSLNTLSSPSITLNPVDVGSRLAVGRIPTRKIKNLIN